MSQPNTMRGDVGTNPAPAAKPESAMPARERTRVGFPPLTSHVPSNAAIPSTIAEADAGNDAYPAGFGERKAKKNEPRSFARLSKSEIQEERHRLKVELANITKRDAELRAREEREAKAARRRAREEWSLAVAAGIADAGFFDFEKAVGLVTPEVVIGHALELAEIVDSGSKSDLDALARRGADELARQKAAKASK